MKQMFKCDFCDETGTEDEMQEHEKVCIFNPRVKHCLTCDKYRPMKHYVRDDDWPNEIFETTDRMCIENHQRFLTSYEINCSFYRYEGEKEV